MHDQKWATSIIDILTKTFFYLYCYCYLLHHWCQLLCDLAMLKGNRLQLVPSTGSLKWGLVSAKSSSWLCPDQMLQLGMVHPRLCPDSILGTSSLMGACICFLCRWVIYGSHRWVPCLQVSHATLYARSELGALAHTMHANLSWPQDITMGCCPVTQLSAATWQAWTGVWAQSNILEQDWPQHMVWTALHNYMSHASKTVGNALKFLTYLSSSTLGSSTSQNQKCCIVLLSQACTLFHAVCMWRKKENTYCKCLHTGMQV